MLAAEVAKPAAPATVKGAAPVKAPAIVAPPDITEEIAFCIAVE